MKRRLLLVAVVSGAVLVTTVAVGAAANNDGATPLDPISAAQRTTAQRDYSGVVVLRWADSAGVHQEQEVVRSRAGVLEIGDKGRVVASEPNRLLLDGSAWAARSSNAQQTPEMSSKYTITRAAGPVIADHATTTLSARRTSDNALVERFYVDATGFVLQRESLDGRGNVLRSLAFASVSSNPDAAGLAPMTSTPATSSGPRLVRHVDAPYRAPAKAGEGYRLVARWRHSGSVVQLTYTDGLLSASVFEQPGQLDWNALPAGGEAGEVGGHPAVAYSLPVGDAVVWERAGMVYTAVGDAPRAELLSLALDVSRRTENGTLTRLASVVLEPFRW